MADDSAPAEAAEEQPQGEQAPQQEQPKQPAVEQTDIVVDIAVRERLGSIECRRLRREGMIPGNIYGHGEGSLAIKVRQDFFRPFVEKGEKVFDVKLDGKVQKTLLQELQWDTFGKYIQHFDLRRVDANERIDITLPVELKGDAPGLANGGVLEQVHYDITINAPVYAVPSEIVARIGRLKIGDSVKLGDLNLPRGVECELPDEETIVQILDPALLDQPAEPEESQLDEPELIGAEGDGDSEPSEDAAATEGDS